MLDLYYLTFADISKMSTFKFKQYRSPLSGRHMHVTKDVDGARSIMYLRWKATLELQLVF